MGRMILEAAGKDAQIEVSGIIEREDHPDLGKELCGVKINSNPEIIRECDVTIDFTNPETTINMINFNLKFNKPAVIGTTGLDEDKYDRLKEASKKIPIVYSPNMSLGVNLLFKLVEEVARILKSGYDVELIEAHHRFKKDAPSGTAKKIVEIIKNVQNKSKVVYGREGMIGERGDEIGVLAIRGGDIVGEHTVIFAGIGERIELTHRAHSRMTFAKGAIEAAKFVINQNPGLYNMMDVLGLK